MKGDDQVMKRLKLLNIFVVIISVSILLVAACEKQSSNPPAPSSVSFKLPTSIQLISIGDDSPAGIYWSPYDQKSVISEVISWLEKAKPYTVKVPESEDVGRFNFNIGPSILNITTLSHHEFIYPAWYTKRGGQKNNVYSAVHYVKNVVVVKNGKEITYLESEPLYNWLKNNEWKKEFIEP